MNYTLLWKEYRQQRAVWWAIVVLGILMVVGLSEALTPGGFFYLDRDDRLRPVLIVLLLCLAIAYGVVCGALLLAGEKDDGTLTYLDIHSVDRGPVWQAKLGAGILFSFTQGIALGGILLFSRLGTWQLAVIVLGITLDALLYGLLGGALCPTVFTAVLAGVVLLAGTFAVALLTAGPIAAIIKILFATASIYVAYRQFCEPDLNRRASLQAPSQVVSPRAWRVLVWLMAQQGRWLLAIGTAAAILGALAVNQLPLVSWPLLTWALSLACGLAMFSPEQIGEQQKFLGAWRIPPTLFWGIKLAFWGGSAVGLSALLWVTAFGFLLLQGSHTGAFTGDYGFWRDRWLSPGILRGMDVRLLLVLWPLYGFTFGQYFAQLARRPILATILAAGGSGLALAFWVPSVIAGGLALWQVAIPPILLLVATRAGMWPWMSSRLQTLRPMIAMSVAPLVGGLWIGGVLAHRATEIPDLGEPFDVAAYQSKLKAFKDEEAGMLLRQADMKLVDQRNLVEMKLGQPSHSPFPPEDMKTKVATEKLSYTRIMVDIMERGWPHDDAEIARYLEEMFQGEWAVQVHAAARMPLGLVQDPRDVNRHSLNEVSHYQDMVALLGSRSRQRLAKGDLSGSLEDLETLLGLSRQIRNHTIPGYLVHSGVIERAALQGMNDWLEQAASKVEPLRRGWDVLARHVAQRPALVDNWRANYFVLLQWRPSWEFEAKPGAKDITPEVLDRLSQVPWEAERRRRIFQAAFLGELERLRLSYVQAAAQKRGLWSVPESGWTAERWGQVFAEAPMLRSVSYFLPRHTEMDAQLQTHLDAMRLVVALALYKVERGQLPARLADLVPAYLAEVPVNALRDTPFRYRTSSGEEIAGHFGGNFYTQCTIRIPNGQGVIWTEGDANNDEKWIYFPVPMGK